MGDILLPPPRGARATTARAIVASGRVEAKGRPALLVGAPGSPSEGGSSPARILFLGGGGELLKEVAE